MRLILAASRCQSRVCRRAGHQRINIVCVDACAPRWTSTLTSRSSSSGCARSATSRSRSLSRPRSAGHPGPEHAGDEEGAVPDQVGRSRKTAAAKRGQYPRSARLRRRRKLQVILVDANILVYAHVASYPQHAIARPWLDEKLNGLAQVGLPWVSLLAFARVVTNRRLFDDPKTVSLAWTQIQDWLQNQSVWSPQPTRTIPPFSEGC